MTTAICRHTARKPRPRNTHTRRTCAGTSSWSASGSIRFAGYAGATDEQLGRLLSAIGEARLEDTTNVVYTSDHGEMLGKFGLWWKCSLLEDAARIPCIAAGPDFESGARVATPVDLHDLQATVFSLTGARHPENWLGVPLATLPDDDGNRVVFSEYHGHGTRAGAFMVRQGEWKLIHNIEAPDQLFDLGNDPQELENRYRACPQKAEELSAALTGICDPAAEDREAEAAWERQVRLNQQEEAARLAR